VAWVSGSNRTRGRADTRPLGANYHEQRLQNAPSCWHADRMPSETGATIRGTGCLLTQATGEPLPKGGHLAQLVSVLLGRVDGPGRLPRQVELPRRGAHQAREQALGHGWACALQGVPEDQLVRARRNASRASTAGHAARRLLVGNPQPWLRLVAVDCGHDCSHDQAAHDR
jgi:hypothetical protein